jgi:hypothetical protein
MPASDAAKDYDRRMRAIVDARHSGTSGTGWAAYPIIPVPEGMRQKIAVSKQTHRIRFEDETETDVNIVIEPKENAAS